MLLWDSINVFERECRNVTSSSNSANITYALPIAILRLLLSSSWSPHRRGRWYERLIINLSHEGRHDEACQVAGAAVVDARVKVCKYCVAVVIVK